MLPHRIIVHHKNSSPHLLNQNSSNTLFPQSHEHQNCSKPLFPQSLPNVMVLISCCNPSSSSQLSILLVPDSSSKLSSSSSNTRFNRVFHSSNANITIFEHEHHSTSSSSKQGQNGWSAHLFSHAMNITVGPKEERRLLTGLHTIANVFCSYFCEVLGWKYERAYEETQKYKEVKFILEKVKIVKLVISD